MSKTKEITIKRLWNNIASIRDYVVKEAIDSGTTIRLTLLGKKQSMTLSPDKLKDKQFQILGDTFDSKYKHNMKYKLVDFSWKPDAE